MIHETNNEYFTVDKFIPILEFSITYHTVQLKIMQTIYESYTRKLTNETTSVVELNPDYQVISVLIRRRW